MHFTYEEAINRQQLLQGDLLARTDEVDALLKDVHPHYNKPDYRFFIVLTQTCDLISRNDEPRKARYLSIAAVRPLRTAVARAIEDNQSIELERKLKFGSDPARNRVRGFVEKLLNNNERDYFYLRREPAVGLDDDCCAFLQLSVAVKTDIHYQTLLSAKRLELTVPFQHKLGYLVGMLYARPGTRDWNDAGLGPEFKALVDQIVKDENLVWWLDRDRYRFVVDRLGQKDPAEWTKTNFITTLGEYKATRESNRKAMGKAVDEAMKGIVASDADREKIVRRLQNHPTFIALVK